MEWVRNQDCLMLCTQISTSKTKSMRKTTPSLRSWSQWMLFLASTRSPLNRTSSTSRWKRSKLGKNLIRPWSTAVMTLRSVMAVQWIKLRRKNLLLKQEEMLPRVSWSFRILTSWWYRNPVISVTKLVHPPWTRKNILLRFSKDMLFGTWSKFKVKKTRMPLWRKKKRRYRIFLTKSEKNPFEILNHQVFLIW